MSIPLDGPLPLRLSRCKAEPCPVWSPGSPHVDGSQELSTASTPAKPTRSHRPRTVCECRYEMRSRGWYRSCYGCWWPVPHKEAPLRSDCRRSRPKRAGVHRIPDARSSEMSRFRNGSLAGTLLGLCGMIGVAATSAGGEERARAHGARAPGPAAVCNAERSARPTSPLLEEATARARKSPLRTAGRASRPGRDCPSRGSARGVRGAPCRQPFEHSLTIAARLDPSSGGERLSLDSGRGVPRCRGSSPSFQRFPPAPKRRALPL
jgi:hypothetical protein